MYLHRCLGSISTKGGSNRGLDDTTALAWIVISSSEYVFLLADRRNVVGWDYEEYFSTEQRWGTREWWWKREKCWSRIAPIIHKCKRRLPGGKNSIKKFCNNARSTTSTTAPRSLNIFPFFLRIDSYPYLANTTPHFTFDVFRSAIVKFFRQFQQWLREYATNLETMSVLKVCDTLSESKPQIPSFGGQQSLEHILLGLYRLILTVPLLPHGQVILDGGRRM